MTQNQKFKKKKSRLKNKSQGKDRRRDVQTFRYNWKSEETLRNPKSIKQEISNER